MTAWTGRRCRSRTQNPECSCDRCSYTGPQPNLATGRPSPAHADFERRLDLGVYDDVPDRMWIAHDEAMTDRGVA